MLCALSWRSPGGVEEGGEKPRSDPKKGRGGCSLGFRFVVVVLVVVVVVVVLLLLQFASAVTRRHPMAADAQSPGPWHRRRGLKLGQSAPRVILDDFLLTLFEATTDPRYVGILPICLHWSRYDLVHKRLSLFDLRMEHASSPFEEHRAKPSRLGPASSCPKPRVSQPTPQGFVRPCGPNGACPTRPWAAGGGAGHSAFRSRVPIPCQTSIFISVLPTCRAFRAHFSASAPEVSLSLFSINRLDLLAPPFVGPRVCAPVEQHGLLCW